MVGGLTIIVECDAIRTPIIHIQLQVQESGLTRVENAQAIASGFDGRFGIDSAVGEHRVTEHLRDNRWIGRQTLRMGS